MLLSAPSSMCDCATRKWMNRTNESATMLSNILSLSFTLVSNIMMKHSESHPMITAETRSAIYFTSFVRYRHLHTFKKGVMPLGMFYASRSLSLYLIGWLTAWLTVSVSFVHIKVSAFAMRCDEIAEWNEWYACIAYDFQQQTTQTHNFIAAVVACFTRTLILYSLSFRSF